jgi:hypothetical protein
MPVDPHSENGKQHEPRAPGARADEPGLRQDHPKKPFRTPSKNKTHAAPDVATDGDPEMRRKN